MTEVNKENSSVSSVIEFDENSRERSQSKYRDGTKLLVISGIAALAAGVITSAVAKRRARQYLASQGHELEQLPESGTALAFRALCYATVITVGTFSLAIFGVCKWFNINNVSQKTMNSLTENNVQDLRTKIRQTRKSAPQNPDERTEFENLSDFLNYLNDRYGKSEKGKS